MFHNLFNPDSGLMITLSQITDAIFLSLFFLLGCIPLVTVGSSAAALYDAGFRAFRKGEKHSWSRFFQSFRRNLVPGILPSLVYLAVLFVTVKGGVARWNYVAAGGSWVLLSLGLVLGAAIVGILSVLFPMLSRFENSTGALLKNTLFLSLANLPKTLVLGIINGGSLILCAQFIVPVFLLPALSVLLSSFFLEPMFKPYMGEEEELTVDN